MIHWYRTLATRVSIISDTVIPQYARQTQVEYTIGVGKKKEVCVRDKRNTLLLFFASFLLVIIGYTKIYSIATKYEFGPVRFEI